MNARRTAFTLIEIMLAVVLLALLASAAAMSFTQPLRAARAQDAIELFRSFDETARQSARRFGQPITLTFDFESSTLSRVENGSVVYRSRLPHDCRLQEIRTGTRRTSDGEISLPCSTLGITGTYAVRVSGPGFDRWLLFSGLSGESTLIQNESQLDAIFAATAARPTARGMEDAPRDDAD